MANLLADLCLESEANTLTAIYLSAIYDASLYSYTQPTSFPNSLLTSRPAAPPVVDPQQTQELFRIGVAVGKYWVTKRYPNFAYECMEVFGGNGYVEDFPMATLFRQSPLNAIWEGSGNVIALDILRAHKSFPVLLQEIKQAMGCDSGFDHLILDLEKQIQELSATNALSMESQRGARNLADKFALAFQASILIRYGDAVVSDLHVLLTVFTLMTHSPLLAHSFRPPELI
jgi:putative acyl-CoA dehydrogenase